MNCGFSRKDNLVLLPLRKHAPVPSLDSDGSLLLSDSDRLLMQILLELIDWSQQRILPDPNYNIIINDQITYCRSAPCTL
mmetsp:Transcript_27953/g.42256  ORF Transcript_27953/g.42256 Transcript_27953/m.42256 type:complete len:80 (-) Transcript_27953:248-487(-)